MNRPLPWFWILLVGLLLAAPTPLGRVLLDLLGGLTLAVLLLPLLLAGAGAIAFQVIKRRVRTCTVCGLSSLASVTCPACGAPLPSTNDGVPTPYDSQPSGPVNAAAPRGLASWFSPASGRPSDPPATDGNLDVSDVTIDVQSTDVEPR
ncbi:hypothetical protein KQ304_09790 [Synechococcus sp. CS-1329]|jgi:hypothetical protein|uniref:hypothetical protein n=1 Tax=Synechococcus sp. CS-1329 TaxID=2847975 RepID=UPI00223B1728|nr:hypothetical protein [Synechococcus sp. CS-1329]MCT0219287.1 hypothetical protein [Synechococcus sp. CS-1329]